VPKFKRFTVPSQLLPSSLDSSNLISPLPSSDKARTLKTTEVIVPRSADSSNVNGTHTDNLVAQVA